MSWIGISTKLNPRLLSPSRTRTKASAESKMRIKFHTMSTRNTRSLFLIWFSMMLRSARHLEISSPSRRTLTASLPRTPFCGELWTTIKQYHLVCSMVHSSCGNYSVQSCNRNLCHTLLQPALCFAMYVYLLEVPKQNRHVCHVYK